MKWIFNTNNQVKNKHYTNLLKIFGNYDIEYILDFTKISWRNSSMQENTIFAAEMPIQSTNLKHFITYVLPNKSTSLERCAIIGRCFCYSKLYSNLKITTRCNLF